MYKSEVREDAKFLGCSTLAVLIVVGLVVFLSIGGWLGRVYFAEQIGEGNTKIIVNSAEFRMQAYPRFFNQCVAAQNAEANIDAALLMDDGEPNKSTVLFANRAARAAAINDYNQMVQQDYTVGQWKDVDLPYQLDSAPYDGTNKTLCAGQ